MASLLHSYSAGPNSTFDIKVPNWGSFVNVKNKDYVVYTALAKTYGTDSVGSEIACVLTSACFC